MFKDFENIHPSKKAAFVDGALTAAIITYFVNKWLNESRVEKAYLAGHDAATKLANTPLQFTE